MRIETKSRSSTTDGHRWTRMPGRCKKTGGVKFHAAHAKFLRAWVDFSMKSRKNGMASAMLAMGTEMKTQRTTRGNRAITLTELLVVICVVAVVAALLLPALAGAKRKSSRIGCINCLKEDGFAFRLWEGDNDDKYPMQVSVTNGGAMELAVAGDVAGIFRVMSNQLTTLKVLVCPEDTNRHYATNFTTDLNNRTISYFVGLDAEEKYPQMILSGDDNLTVNGVRVRPGILNLWTNASVGWTKERHDGAGNFALVDGSVQTMALTFQSWLVNTGFATNRLVIP
jgi:prepilin-type processing-associated H-X9-DG protein